MPEGYANFQTIKDYIIQFTTPFNVITISETWFNLEKGVDFQLEGYELHEQNKQDGKGDSSVCR